MTEIYFCIKVDGKHWAVALAVDAFTKYTEGEALDDKTAISIATFIWKNIFCRYLTPIECIIHDRDTTLGGKVMKYLFEKFNCEIRVSVEGRPESNGQVEIFIKTFKERLNSILINYGNLLLFVLNLLVVLDFLNGVI